jgi:hypothetical protein
LRYGNRLALTLSGNAVLLEITGGEVAVRPPSRLTWCCKAGICRRRAAATHVAQGIDVAPWYGGLLQSKPVSIFGIFGAGFRLSTDFSGYTLFGTIFSIICPTCQFWIFLKAEIFRSIFGGERI